MRFSRSISVYLSIYKEDKIGPLHDGSFIFDNMNNLVKFLLTFLELVFLGFSFQMRVSLGSIFLFHKCTTRLHFNQSLVMSV